MEQLAPGNGEAGDGGDGSCRRVPDRGTLSLPDAAWTEAQRRAAVVGPMAAQDAVSAMAARDAGLALGLSERTIYVLLRRWRQSGGLAAVLAPRPSPGGRGKGRLPAAVERIVAEAIRDEYLTRQKKRAEAVVRAVRDRCRLAGIKSPAANTVRVRVRRVRADLAAHAREGASSAAARRLAPAAGRAPPSGRPMAVLQIDHTPVDLILVDETWRKPVGRSWLTLAIDVHSRCIAGLHLSFEAPSATVAGLCLAHAALDKAATLRAIGVEADWPCQGRPGEVFVDNGPGVPLRRLRARLRAARHCPAPSAPGRPTLGRHHRARDRHRDGHGARAAGDHVLEPGRAGRVRRRQGGLPDLGRTGTLVRAGRHRSLPQRGAWWPGRAAACALAARHRRARAAAGRHGPAIVRGGLPAGAAAPMSRCRAAGRGGPPFRCTSTAWRWRTCGRRAGRRWTRTPSFGPSNSSARSSKRRRSRPVPPASTSRARRTWPGKRRHGRAQPCRPSQAPRQGRPAMRRPSLTLNPTRRSGGDGSRSRPCPPRARGAGGPAARRGAARAVARGAVVDRPRPGGGGAGTVGGAAARRTGQIRPPNLLLAGPTNNGKSWIVERFVRAHELPGDEDAERRPVVAMQMPTEPTVARFYAALLTRLGAPVARVGPGTRKHDLEQLALRVLRGVGARMLVIDELNNMLGGTRTARGEFLNLLRWLGNELRIPIVGAGTRDAWLAIRTDPQLENRFEPFVLPAWRPGPEAARLLQGFATLLPLRRPSDLRGIRLVSSVLARTGGTIGEVSALLRAAAEAAIAGGEERITPDVLARAAYRGPAERRQTVERELA